MNSKSSLAAAVSSVWSQCMLVPLLALGALACQAPAASEQGDGAPADAAGGAVEARLAELGIALSDPPAPVANYVRAVTTGNLVFLAGHIPSHPNGARVIGRLGADMDVRAGLRSRTTGGHRPVVVPARRDRRPGPRDTHRQGAGHGQLDARFHPAVGGDQRLLRSAGRGVRRARQACTGQRSAWPPCRSEQRSKWR